MVSIARIIDGSEMNRVGKNVRKYRTAKNISQQELSNRLEIMAIYICRGSISRIEDMSRTVTDIELLGLAKALNISVLDLFDPD